MFLSLMLVGYATSKLTDRKSGQASWYARLFEKKAATVPTPVNDEPNWELGAEAWVSVPPQSEC